MENSELVEALVDMPGSLVFLRVLSDTYESIGTYETGSGLCIKSVSTKMLIHQVTEGKRIRKAYSV